MHTLRQKKRASALLLLASEYSSWGSCVLTHEDVHVDMDVGSSLLKVSSCSPRVSTALSILSSSSYLQIKCSSRPLLLWSHSSSNPPALEYQQPLCHTIHLLPPIRAICPRPSPPPLGVLSVCLTLAHHPFSSHTTLYRKLINSLHLQLYLSVLRCDLLCHWLV